MKIEQIAKTVSDADENSGRIILRGTLRSNDDITVGTRVCIDRENIARVFEVKAVRAFEDLDENDCPVAATAIEVEGIHRNGDYAILPDEDAIDIRDRVIRMTSRADKKRRLSHLSITRYTGAARVCEVHEDCRNSRPVATLMDENGLPLEDWLWHKAPVAHRRAQLLADGLNLPRLVENDRGFVVEAD